FASLAPNMQVKIPGTRAGMQAVEDVTAAGVTINTTVCFTVPQAIAAAEAVDRGLARFEADGGDSSAMSPVVTMMVGRLDDWMQVLVGRDRVTIDPGYPHWAGIACFKKAYPVFQERGYRARLLAAAYRHPLHWTEFVGGGGRPPTPHAAPKPFNAPDPRGTPGTGEAAAPPPR